MQMFRFSMKKTFTKENRIGISGYVIDLDAEMIYNLGIDGEAFTSDDTKLFIDPKILGLE